MADMITPNFSKSEMACRCGCGIFEMDDEFMRMLQELRNQMQGPLRVSSARRCDTHNHEVSTAKNKKNGVHTLGQASDILIFGPEGYGPISKGPSDRLQWNRCFTEGRPRLKICPPGHETPKSFMVVLSPICSNFDDKIFPIGSGNHCRSRFPLNSVA